MLCTNCNLYDNGRRSLSPHLTLWLPVVCVVVHLMQFRHGDGEHCIGKELKIRVKIALLFKLKSGGDLWQLILSVELSHIPEQQIVHLISIHR